MYRKLGNSLFFFVLGVFVALTGCVDGFNVNAERDEVTIGVLLPLSGDLSATGLSQKAAIEMALADVNQAFENEGKSFRIKVDIQDDQSSPSVALQKIQDMFVANIRVVVGPESSQQVHRILPFAHDNGITIISPSSTSPSLRSDKSENLFRMVSDDQYQTKVLANLVKTDGFEQLVTIARNDLYGSDFESFLSKSFQEVYGGNIFHSYVYDTPTTDFGPFMVEMRTDMNYVNNTDPFVPTAIQVTAFDEIVAILNAASVQVVLQNTQWYGCDGFAMSPALVADTVAANFAIQTDLKATAWTFDPAYQSNFDDFANRLSAIFTEDVPNLEDALVYDALTLAAKTAESLKGVLAATAWQNRVPIVAATLVGATGPLTLDANGDRLENHYAVWKVRSNGIGGFEWFKDATLAVP